VQITIINQQKKIPISKRAIRATVLKILKILYPSGNNLKLKSKGKIYSGVQGQLNIVYVNNKAIQELNFQFLGKRCPTDVLCFDLSGGGRIAADIVISTEKACENSRLFKTSAFWEARLYLVHGILHLFGYNDRRKRDRIRMHRQALRIMRQI
jgi:probable rRNA maturation factor